jgi:hypothetical protein
MMNRQRGLTTIGWMVLLVPVAIVLYGVLRAAPAYLNYMKVARSLEQTAAEFRGEEQLSPQRIRSSIERRFDIEAISYPTAREVEIRREGPGWVLEASYEDLAPLFANVSLLLAFDKQVEID